MEKAGWTRTAQNGSSTVDFERQVGSKTDAAHFRIETPPENQSFTAVTVRLN